MASKCGFQGSYSGTMVPAAEVTAVPWHPQQHTLWVSVYSSSKLLWAAAVMASGGNVSESGVSAILQRGGDEFLSVVSPAADTQHFGF